MKRKIVFAAVAVLSLIMLTFNTLERIGVEKGADKIELLLDYEESESMSKQSGKSIESWMKLFKNVGFSSVALKEESLYTLSNDPKRHIEMNMTDDLKRDYIKYRKLPKKVKKHIENREAGKNDVLVMTDRKSDYDFITRGLKSRYDDVFKVYKGGIDYYILISGDESSKYTPQGDDADAGQGKSGESDFSKKSCLENIGLGFDPQKIETVKRSGLRPLLMPKNYPHQSGKLVEAFMKDAVKYDAVPKYLLFDGDSILGYSDAEQKKVSSSALGEYPDKALLEAMKVNKIAVGMLEPLVQRGYEEKRGIKELAEATDYNVVRVFQVVEYIQKRYGYLGYDGPQEIENTIYRAVTERNLKSIYFRPFMDEKGRYITDAKVYRESFARLEARLVQHNIGYGEASTFKPVHKTPVQIAMLGMGVVLAAIVAFSTVFSISDKSAFSLLGMGGILVFIMSALKPDVSQAVLAFSSSIVFPTLAIAVLVEFMKLKISNEEFIFNMGTDNKFILLGVLKEVTALFLITMPIVLLGGLYIGCILSEASYIVEMNVFRGVKVSQMMPPLVFIAIYFVKLGYNKSLEEIGKTKSRSLSDIAQDIKSFFNTDIKIWHLAAFVFVSVAGIIYIARTGHESAIQPSSFELMFRNVLEDGLLARPRTKEFLIAFPSLVILIYAVNRRFKWALLPLGAVGSIVYGSIVNTFSHIRTPLYMSFVRTKYSLLFGLLIGIVIVLILELIYNKMKKCGRSEIE